MLSCLPVVMLQVMVVLVLISSDVTGGGDCQCSSVNLLHVVVTRDVLVFICSDVTGSGDG